MNGCMYHKTSLKYVDNNNNTNCNGSLDDSHVWLTLATPREASRGPTLSLYRLATTR